MKTKTNNRNKFIRIITTPFRALGKARDLYVRSMNSAEKLSYASTMGGPAGQFNALPKSFSVRSSRSNDTNDDDYAELIRAASARSYGGRIDMDAILRQQLREEAAKTKPSTAPTTTTGVRGLPKCGSVGMGKIDEEKAVEFGEDGTGDSDAKPELLYPRSRSYAVAKRGLVY
ncbi:uncharacterized protein LOC133804092 [Humulus lupulus]|uniref:uncharacterized protein LOC133804092 n=1 Tax=Humulus lupulus TaxID=3486 RepID=UPI002B41581B|nr:uncharacterized protein LOC133804092 [Humulus lupulus]